MGYQTIKRVITSKLVSRVIFSRDKTPKQRTLTKHLLLWKVVKYLNLFAISFPNNFASDRCGLVSIEIRPFDKIFNINCKKVGFFPICICTVASVPFGGTFVMGVNSMMLQGLTITIKSPYMITYMCQNFGVRDVLILKFHSKKSLP